MNTNRACGCKGFRTCLICEKEYNLTPNVDLDNTLETYTYCIQCGNKAWNNSSPHSNHTGESIQYDGVYILKEFLSVEEEERLMNGIDNELKWDLSQSGRRKQNFGPKCNFKKRKLAVGDFTGFPAFTKFVQDKFQTIALLTDYQTIEQCSLEYDPERGAAIDPHIDDCWIWGERIITVNLCADSILTMTPNTKPTGYNLECVDSYPSIVSHQPYKPQKCKYNVKVCIPMPRRSLLVLYGQARYDWEHQVLRDDITKRRVCLAYREFTPPYLPNGERHNESEEVYKRAQLFI